MKKTDIIWVSLAVLIDQMSKMVVESFLELNSSIEVIPGFFSINYVRNTGAAFSILEGKMYFFYIVTAIAICVMVYSFRKVDKNNIILRTALILMIGGALGNYIDRIFLQYVRDFLSFTFFNYQFAVFNIADSLLCIGVGLVFIDTFLEERRAKLNG